MPEFAKLLEGYERFRGEFYKHHEGQYSKLAEHGQHPELMIISCSDSRVDPAQIFDVDPGDIFVVRNVAALVPPEHDGDDLDGVAAAVEFAVGVLKVRQIVVMGHSLCGGCQAALTNAMAGREPGEGGYVARWVNLLSEQRKAISQELGNESAASKRAMEHAAVRASIANLRTYSQVAAREVEGSLVLRGTHFTIHDGVLHVLNQETGEFLPAE